MRETPEDLQRLQALLDDSYARAGEHLRMIHTLEARLTARQVVGRLDGMRVFVVATVSARGRPLTGPVDTYLVRGRLHFGTAPAAVRARHLEENPAVSATYVEGEGLVVTVHGRVVPVDHAAGTPYGDVLRERHDDVSFFDGTPNWAIEPDRMFAADMTVHQQAAGTA